MWSEMAFRVEGEGREVNSCKVSIGSVLEIVGKDTILYNLTHSFAPRWTFVRRTSR